MWLYSKPWALPFLVFMCLKIYLSWRLFLFPPKKCYFSSSLRPTAKRGTSIIVPVSNSVIFAIRLASDLIHGKKVAHRLFSSLTTRLQGCLSLLFLLGCANYFRKLITVIRKCKVLLCSLNFSGFCFSISWFTYLPVVELIVFQVQYVFKHWWTLCVLNITI